MSLYLATQITERLKTMLEGLTIDAGARTDIGKNVLLNEAVSATRNFPCAVLTEGPETGQGRAGGLIQTDIEYSIAAFDQARHATPHHYTMGNMIADIREALETPGCRFIMELPVKINYDGCTRYPIEEGGDVIGVELRYTITFAAVDGDFSTSP